MNLRKHEHRIKLIYHKFKAINFILGILAFHWHLIWASVMTWLTYCRFTSQFLVCDISAASSICHVNPLQHFLSCASSVISVRSLLECSLIGCWISDILNKIAYHSSMVEHVIELLLLITFIGLRGQYLLEYPHMFNFMLIMQYNCVDKFSYITVNVGFNVA